MLKLLITLSVTLSLFLLPSLAASQSTSAHAEVSETSINLFGDIILATPFFLDKPKLTSNKTIYKDNNLVSDNISAYTPIAGTHKVVYKNVDLLDIPTSERHPSYDPLVHSISKAILEQKNSNGTNILGNNFDLNLRVELKHSYGSEWKKSNGDLTERECQWVRQEAQDNFRKWLDIDQQTISEISTALNKNKSASTKIDLQKLTEKMAIDQNLIFSSTDTEVRKKYITKVLTRIAPTTTNSKGGYTRLFSKKKAYCFYENYRESENYKSYQSKASALIESPLLKSVNYDISLLSFEGYNTDFKNNKIYSVVINDDLKILKGTAQDPEEILVSVDILYNQNNEHFLRKYNLIYYPKQETMPLSLQYSEDIVPLANLKPKVEADSAKTVMSWTDSEYGFTRVYPMGVGAIDFETLKDNQVSSLTGQFQWGSLSKKLEHQNTIKERWDPYYYKGRPFIRISGSSIGFHYQIDSANFKRGYRSHGCIRLRDKNLFELYAIVRQNSYENKTPLSLKYSNNKLKDIDHPLPWNKKIHAVKNYGHSGYKMCVRVGSGGSTPLIYTTEQDMPAALAFKNTSQSTERRKCWRIKHSEYASKKDDVTGEKLYYADVAAKQLFNTMLTDNVSKECIEYQTNCPEKYQKLTGRAASTGYTFDYSWD